MVIVFDFLKVHILFPENFIGEVNFIKHLLDLFKLSEKRNDFVDWLLIFLDWFGLLFYLFLLFGIFHFIHRWLDYFNTFLSYIFPHIFLPWLRNNLFIHVPNLFFHLLLFHIVFIILFHLAYFFPHILFCNILNVFSHLSVRFFYWNLFVHRLYWM